MDPQTIGPYVVTGRLGEGAMGLVYRGRRAEGGPEVAIKVARTGEATASNLRSELRALGRIQDPRIVRLVGYGEAEGAPWYAMEYVEGQTWQAFNRELWGERARPAPSNPTLSFDSLADDTRTGEGPAFDPGGPVLELGRPVIDPAAPRRRAANGRLVEVLTLARRLCPALSILHGNGLVHRDLKPANVLIRPDGTPVVMDLGVVSRFRGAVGRERVEVAGNLVGTLAYMAPEQARGLRVDARADLYSLGCMLYESVTGRLPVEGATIQTMLSRVIAEPPEPPSTLVDGIPPELEDLLLALLAKDPGDRIGYADDVARVLARLGAEDDGPPVPARPYLYRPALVGRAEPLKVLEEAVVALGEGAGGRVLVGGESGVGKTFLVSEAARLARLRRIGVIVGEALPTLVTDVTVLDYTGAPLHPLRTFFVALADRCRLGGDTVADRLLRGHAPELAPFEPLLAALPAAAAAGPAADLPAEVARPRLLLALREVLEAWLADQGPQVLVLDDLQWADELTMALLRSLDPAWLAAHPLLVVGTWRTEEMTRELDDLLGAPGVRRIELTRLGPADVGSIVGEMLAIKDPPGAVLDAVRTWSEGNPFFVAEYLRMAAAEGHLSRRDGRWVFGAESGRSLPDPRSVQELVARRLGGLPEGSRALLEVASVLGREFSLSALRALTGQEADALADQLRDLEGRHIVEAVGEERWRFVHDKLRETVHARLPADRRRALHREAAAALEADRSAACRVLAYHWREAEDWPKALDYLERAGEEALATFATAEAASCFEEVRSLAERLSEAPGERRQARWDRLLADARLDLGDQRQGQEHVEAALARLGMPPLPATPTAQGLGLLGEVLTRVVQGLAPGLFRESRPDRQAALADAAHLYNRLLEPKMLNNEPLLGLYCGLRNLNLADRVPRSAALARGYGMMAAIVVNTPLKGVARAWADRAIEVAEAVGGASTLSYALHRSAVAYFALGGFDEALRRWDRAGGLASRDGDRRRLDEVRIGRAIAAGARGRWATVVDEARAALTSATERGDGQSAAWARAALLEAYARLGRETDVQALLPLEGLDRLGDGERLWLHISLAVARMGGGDRAGARAAADEALAIASRAPPVGYFIGAPLGSLAEVSLLLAERALRDDGAAGEEALTRLDRACRLVEGFVKMNPFANPYAWTWRGSHAWLLGRRSRAERLWRRAVAEAERLGMIHAQAAALAELGLRLGDAGARERAAALFAEAGATRDRVRVVEAGG